MKSLEQDALKAQMVIAKSKEPRKRSPLDQLSESPSPAATPSPTPLDDHSPRSVTSPGRLSPDLIDDLMYVDDGSTSVSRLGEDSEGMGDTRRLPTLTALGNPATYSHKRSLQPPVRSTESTVPT
ncbi:protein scribble homolog isoform X2 [Scyliorhinus canicula]|uniref:protein scribble homolog isoform X2 n=1 Tax=Scyliorhinus canicula TaxID=7830 RepID=UPI0018F56806|nr:protein scribble homolog isoform X2 [Scyliorhinus canicula]